MMAKQILIASSDNAGPSSASLDCLKRDTKTNNNPHRRRRRPTSPFYSFSPSSGVLSLLATIAASSLTVDGSPTPPPFLCPSLDPEVAHHPEPREVSLDDSIPSSPNPSNGRPMPDKYERGDDGVWRRVEVYTLYGSTVCHTCREPTNAVTSVDDQIQSSSSDSHGSNSSAPSTPSYDIHDSLPPGWQALNRPLAGRTTLILSLSLVLAFFICFFMIGCLVWRKRQRRIHRQSDVEMKARKKTGEESKDTLIEKEIKAKQKIWARATARWKANVRHAARQRRGKRSAKAAFSNNLNISLTNNRSQDRLTTASVSQSPSPSQSRRPSISIVQDNDSTSIITASLPSTASEQEEGSPTILLIAPINQSSSPPAYRQRTSLAPLPDQTRRSRSPSSRSHISSSRQSSISSIRVPQQSDHAVSDADIETPHVAHVATDDKAILARLADLASAPFDIIDEENAHPSSAPVWHDEEFSDFSSEPGSSSYPDHISGLGSPSLPFPPPPTKCKIAMSNYYDLPYEFDDISSADPEPEPSAPPFESHCSPPGNEDLVPSAPPLSDGDYSLDLHPSAVQWGYQDQQTEERHADVQHCDGERIHVVHMPNPSPCTTETSQSTLVQGPVSSDGTPPLYHP